MSACYESTFYRLSPPVLSYVLSFLENPLLAPLILRGVCTDLNRTITTDAQFLRLWKVVLGRGMHVRINPSKWTRIIGIRHLYECYNVERTPVDVWSACSDHGFFDRRAAYRKILGECRAAHHLDFDAPEHEPDTTAAAYRLCQQVMVRSAKAWTPYKASRLEALGPVVGALKALKEAIHATPPIPYFRGIGRSWTRGRERAFQAQCRLKRELEHDQAVHGMKDTVYKDLFPRPRKRSRRL